MAFTVSASPIGDVTASGTWTQSAGSRWQFLDDYPASAGGDTIVHGTTAGTLVLSSTPFTLPSNYIVSGVEVYYYDAKSAAQSANMQARLRVGTLYYNTGSHNPNSGASGTLRVGTWTTNPQTSLAWTVADVNGTGSNPLKGFGFFSTDASPTITIWSVMIQVTYTIPGASRSYALIC